MARDIHADTQTALSEEKLWPVLLVELSWETGTTRFWSGVGELVSPDGNTWYGAGPLGADAETHDVLVKVSKIEETSELKAVGVVLTLSGVPEEVLDIAKGQLWQGRPARIYFGVIEETAGGRQWVGEPIQLFGGVMDQMQLTEGTEPAISVKCESALIDLQRTRARRYTAEDQRAEYPGDKFFDAVPSLQEKEIIWGG